MSVTCKQCGNVIGEYVVIDEHEFLKVGTVVMREFHGVCLVCGGELHWSVPDRILARLLERMNKQDRGEVL